MSLVRVGPAWTLGDESWWVGMRCWLPEARRAANGCAQRRLCEPELQRKEWLWTHLRRKSSHHPSLSHSIGFSLFFLKIYFFFICFWLCQVLMVACGV